MQAIRSWLLASVFLFLGIIAELYDTKTGVVLESQTIRDDLVKKPEKITGLGYRHKDQIKILQVLQDFKIKPESALINQDLNCPKCGCKGTGNGRVNSNLHAPLTDHKVSIQRLNCRCGWKIQSTVEGIYGSSLHPDLLEKQAKQGAENSYAQASKNLNAESCNVRPINNDDRIRRSVFGVAEVFGGNKLAPVESPAPDLAAQDLIVVVDGGHIKSKQDDARSFEAMIATVYRPEHLRVVDKNHNEITQKTSVASALSDQQTTIKQLVKNACHLEGMHPEVTSVTALTDGANNCWSIVNAMKKDCRELNTVLD